MTRELAPVEALTAGDDVAVLKELCRIFEVEADDDAIGADGARGALLQSPRLPATRIGRWRGRPDREGQEPSGEGGDAAMLTRAFTMEAHPRPC